MGFIKKIQGTANVHSRGEITAESVETDFHNLRLSSRSDDFFALIKAAGTNPVGQFHLAALRAVDRIGTCQSMVTTALVALHLCCFIGWNSHFILLLRLLNLRF